MGYFLPPLRGFRGPLTALGKRLWGNALGKKVDNELALQGSIALRGNLSSELTLAGSETIHPTLPGGNAP